MTEEKQEKDRKGRDMIRRIEEMEARLNRAVHCLNQLDEALEQFEAVQEDIRILAAYYESPQWREDFEADEAHLLPADLPRGVLSEDGIYNVLEKYKELKRQLKQEDL